MRVVVIGAGVIGAAVAFRLVEAGASVTLVDQGAPGGGTTSTSFAWLNANAKPPRAYHDLNVAGVHAHFRLRDALGEGPWLHASGNVQCAVGPAADRLAAHVEHLRAWAYPAERIDAAQAAALEPDVRWPAEPGAVFAHFPLEGWAHGPTLVRCLVDAATVRGALLYAGAGVAALAPAGRGWRATLASGRAAEADAVVIAAGRWSDRVAALAGVQLPLAPTCGLLAVTGSVERGPRGVVTLPDFHMRPDGDDRIVLQADDTDAMVGPETPPDPALPGCALLLERARRALPALAEVPIVEARVGIRSLPADSFPVVGPVPGRDGVYLAVTHSGMTLGPLLGELVAAELARGASSPALAPFRPARCVSLR